MWIKCVIVHFDGSQTNKKRKNSPTKGQEDMVESPDRDLSGATGTGTPPGTHTENHNPAKVETNESRTWSKKRPATKKELRFLRRSLRIDSGQLKHPKVNCA